MAHRVGSRAVEELVIASIDGALGEADIRALRAHLTTCAECSALAQQHERLTQRLASPVASETARLTSLQRLRERDKRRGLFSVHLPRLALGVARALIVALVAIGGALGIGEGVGRSQIPEREVVAQKTETLGGDTVVLTVEDGRFAAQSGQTSGILVSADLQLATRRAGSTELRFAVQGEPYGVLGGAPDLTGVTKLRLENRIPPVDSPTIFEIWIHVEAPDPVDSDHVVIRVVPAYGGLRARGL